jgi:hypothetical protein
LYSISCFEPNLLQVPTDDYIDVFPPDAVCAGTSKTLMNEA